MGAVHLFCMFNSCLVDKRQFDCYWFQVRASINIMQCTSIRFRQKKDRNNTGLEFYNVTL